ncbi:hypothetical protein K435DRAFT_840651 [Dendrothele bispora CBS 962.96]|uniref:DUF6532 domain-containing protein n=1 Tax=Dendrothele bispora (strain CBS 962.96) TaxID=1314807 RepID=A0A4S8LTE4_DENBC|nr:hypothetical protein K435DRAFT_840651 [Dendrothele bispora CBS 962.96]
MDEDELDGDDGFVINEAQVIEEKRRKEKKKHSVNVDETGENAIILPHAARSRRSSTTTIDIPVDGRSDASSAIDLFLPEDEDEDDNNTAPAPKGRDAKYEAERPLVTSTTATTNSEKFRASRNEGWDPETHMVYPDGQRAISKRQRPAPLEAVINEAIDITLGLFLLTNAIPDTPEQLSLCSLALTTACNKLQKPKIQYRTERDKTYKKHLTNYLYGRVSHMRTVVIGVARGVVPSTYGLGQLAADERKQLVKALMDRHTFIFPLSDPANVKTLRSNEPYRHPAVVAVLRQALFDGKKAIGRRYMENFECNSDLDDCKEIPKHMLAFIATTIFAVLNEWSTGLEVKAEFEVSSFQTHYKEHLQLLEEKILKKGGKEKYHNLMSYLFREATCRVGTATVSESNLPEIDFDNMA